MRTKAALIGLLLNMSLIPTVFSSHYMGGNISWTCLGNDSFLIKMTIYRDCNGAYFNDLILNFSCISTQNMIISETLSAPVPVDITPVCNNGCSRCQSYSCSFPYGIEKFVYTGVVYLGFAGSCCDILIEHQGASRSTTLTTGDPNSFFYLDAKLNRCLQPCSSSPEYQIDPVRLICVGQDFSFNPVFMDTDKDSNGLPLDSISYEWTPPLVGKNAPFSYSGSYVFDQPIYYWGFPNANLPFPRGIQLNKQNGAISFRPMKIEQSVMALKIGEWRKINGNQTRISETKLDFCIIVISCPSNNAPVISGPFYKEVCANDTVVFSISTNDYDTQDSLIISWNKSIKGAVWTDNNGQVKHPTGTLKWKPEDNKHPSTIPYVFTATVQDNSCPVNGSSTRAYQILVKPLPKAKLSVVDSGCGKYGFSVYSILGSSPVYLWKCNFDPDTIIQTNYFTYQFDKPGKYPFSMQMDAQGCTRIYYDTLEVDTFISLKLPPDQALCEGDTVTLRADYKNNRGPVHFKWHNGDTNQSVSFVAAKDTICSVELGDTTQCVLKGEVHIKVHPLPEVDFMADPPLYYAQGDSFSVQFYDQSTVYNPPASYSWDFGNQTYANQQNPVAIFQDTGTYSVQLQLSDSFACSSQLSKSIHIDVTTIKGNDAENRILIYPNPTKGELNIKSDVTIQEIRLINSLGKEVWNDHDLNTREYQLDALPKGLYFIEILDFQGKLTRQKVIFY